MKNSIILLIKECIASHACIQTENGNVIGLFLDDIAVDHIADDAADALIAADFGDVTEWKRRAEVAEKKYNIALVGYAKCHRKITHYNKMTTTYDREITQQAERDIEEEEK